MPRVMKLFLWWAIAVAALLSWYGHQAWAADTAGDLFRMDPKSAWHIDAGAITYDKQADLYLAVGKVTITKEGKRIVADSIWFDQKNQRLFADGNVTMTAGPDVLSGDHMEMDMAAETGTISNGTVFLGDRHFYILGDTIEKTGPDTYTADRVSFSSCEPGKPDWQITGKDLRLTVEGYGSLRHAALWAKSMPVLYTPYLFFPVKIKRQTGLLVPRVSYSERKWEEIEQPFYWVISDSADMTFYAHHMGRRGEKLGVEYRQVMDATSRTTVMFDFLEDRKANTEAGQDWAYTHDKWLRPNNDRYWLRMKHDHGLGPGLSARLDIDLVSDQDYLLEFESGYTGFDAADRYFEKVFGRDLDDADNPVRTSIFNLQKNWTQNSLNAGVRWDDDVIKRRWADEDDTVQRLPVVSFDANKQKLGATPLFYELNSEYLYGYTEDSLRGHRADIHPRIALPGRFKNFFSFEPSMGFRETVWRMDRNAGADDTDRAQSRELFDLRADLSSELYRVFDVNPETGKRACHTIVPRLEYEYVPHKNQEDYPRFNDAADVIEKQNTVTWSITNLLTVKEWRGAAPSAADALETAESPSLPSVREALYSEAVRLKVSQSYDINEAKEDDPAQWATPDQRRPFSPVAVELDARPANFVRLDGDGLWCPYTGEWQAYNGEIAFSDTRGDKFSGGYRYRQGVSESVYGKAALEVNEAFLLYGEYERNIFSGTDILVQTGVVYRASCWSVDVNYTDEPGDRTYTVMINLYGLGEFGSDISGADVEQYP